MPQWDNQKARTIFEQMLVQTSNKIDAVAAANDGLANAVVDRAQGEEAQADPAVGSGRDGPGRAERHLRLAVRDGAQVRQDRGRPRRPRSRSRCSRAGRRGQREHEQRRAERAVDPRDPIWITKANVNLLYKEGHLKKSEVCVGSYKQYC